MISLREFDPLVSATRKIDNVESAIYLIRGQRVMLDSGLAAIYQVTTKRLNQQLKRNRRRFPKDFAFRLTAEEAADLRSQFVTSKGHGGPRYRPWAFTEHGAIMLASVRRLDSHDEAIVNLFAALKGLLEPPVPTKKREIGFHVRERSSRYRTNKSKIEKPVLSDSRTDRKSKIS